MRCEFADDPDERVVITSCDCRVKKELEYLKRAHHHITHRMHLKRTAHNIAYKHTVVDANNESNVLIQLVLSRRGHLSCLHIGLTKQEKPRDPRNVRSRRFDLTRIIALLHDSNGQFSLFNAPPWIAVLSHNLCLLLDDAYYVMRIDQ